MSVQSATPIPQLFYSPKPASALFVDFVGLCCKSKRTRRRLGLTSRRIHGFVAKNWSSSIRAALDLQHVENASGVPSDLTPKVANLEDIISERGACGVGFIANLENRSSHHIITDALTALGCMEHRGGCGADNDSGDGSGLMTSIPWDLFNHWANKQGFASFDKLHTGVGMVFLPKDDDLMKEAKSGTSSMIFI
ncbi:glutamate synthase 1 [Actinidia rufa]|uniref:glutamate synthase (ferredoxin) n=1 Tax=Actinidia rufa TaxID=165716 RepID=A0A7J0FBR3_9ERIC|nr:glutamate synthase 1 [Actinidia rufa]